MANREKKNRPTRKRLARVERERRQRRYIIIASILVVVSVITLIIVGIVTENIIKPRQPIAEVNGTAITTGEFQAFTRYQRYRVVTEYLSTYQFIQNMGDPNSFSYFESYLAQLQNELQPETLGINVINQMVENVIVSEEAERLGIEVRDEDVEDRINAIIFQYFPDGTPTPTPTSPTLATPTLSELQKTLVPLTPTAIITDTTAVEAEADEAATPTSMPTAVLPTPTLYTEQAYNQNYDEFISYLRNYARVSEEDLFNFYESVILRERVAEAVITEIPEEEEKLWARHILFRNQETGEDQAQAFLALLELGDDFATVAEEIAEIAPADETSGGNVIFEDLGWFGEGSMVEPFEAAAMALEVGEISQPVQTTFGWHVIQLLGRDSQPRSQDSVNQLRSEAFQEWLNLKRSEYSVDISPDWINVVPEEPDIPPQARLQAPQQ